MAFEGDTIAYSAAEMPFPYALPARQPVALDHCSRYTQPQIFVVAALVVGIAARLLMVFIAQGSNDMATWEDFANRIASYGLLDTYRSMPLFNHPPLMGWYAALCQLFANGTGIPFPWCFKIPIVIVDCVAVWLIARHWGASRGKWAGLVAAAVFSLNPVSVLVTSYHGNTDSLCAVFGLCAVVLYDRGRPGLAGLMLGAAINVKLIAALWVPGLLLLCTSWRQTWWFLLALAATGLPFLVPLIGAFDAFSRNAIEYNSLVDSWGVNLVPLFFRAQFPELAEWIIGDYRSFGRYVILGGVALLAIGGRWKKWNSATTATMALALFLLLTPGFGVQYLVWVVPVMAVASTFWSVAWALTAGSFALWIYVAFLVSSYPLQSVHSTIPRPIGMWGATAWGVLAAYVLTNAVWGPQRAGWPRAAKALGARLWSWGRAAGEYARRLPSRRRAQVLGVSTLIALGAFATVTEVTRYRLGKDKAKSAAWQASSQFAVACRSPEKKCLSSAHYFFHTQLEASPWIRLDLGTPQAISSVYIVNRNDCCRERATPLVVEVGDGDTWTAVARRRQPFSTWWPSFATVTARYVRVRVEGTNYLHLQDIKVL